MTDFGDSTLGKLRQLVGSRLLLVPGARIVIQRPDKKILLQFRSDFRIWGLPGGNAEENESMENLIRREVMEETGFQIDAFMPFGFASDPQNETITFPNGDRCQFFVLLFYCNHSGGDKLVVDSEGLGLDWYDPNNLPAMLPNMRRTIEAFQRFTDDGSFQLI